MTKVPYAPYPKFGPEVLGQREYDKQMQAWEAYQASLRMQHDDGENEHGGDGSGEGLKEHDGHYDDQSGGQGGGDGDGDNSLETYTYTRKYTLPGQTRQRRFREQGILAPDKGTARKMGREAMENQLGERGVKWEPVRGSEKTSKPRGKPFDKGDDGRRNDDGKNGHGKGSGSGSGEGQGEGSGEGDGQNEGDDGEGSDDDDIPKPPTCPECGAPRGSTEGCCKQDDPGEIPPPKANEEHKHDLQLLRTDGAPYMNGEAEARLRQGAHPEVVEVLQKSLNEVDTWTRAVVKHDVDAMATELYEALAASHKSLTAKIGKAPKGGESKGSKGMQTRDALSKAQIRGLVEELLKSAKIDTDALAERVAEKLNAPRRIVIESQGETREISGVPHKQFDSALKAVNRGLWPFLVGPAGSGKGFLAQHLAEAKGARYGFVSCSEGMSEGMLLGRGVPLADRFLYLQSSFVDFYENGGVFLLDEIDAANPNVLLIINECLSSPHLAIPNRTEKPYADRHPDFVAIVAANTWGTGPNMEYVGRNRLDAAFLNRFAGSQFEIDYDPRVESEIAKAHLGAKKAESVLRRFWGVRKKLEELQIRRIWSTRGLQKMCVALADGDDMSTVLDAHTSSWTTDERNKAGVA